MKPVLLFIVFIAAAISCTKPSSGKEVVEKMPGTYNCSRVSFTWSLGDPFHTYDSIYPVTVVITQASSTSLNVNGHVLPYQTDWDGKHVFGKPAGNENYELRVAKDYSSFVFTTESGDSIGGNGYIYRWPQ